MDNAVIAFSVTVFVLSSSFTPSRAEFRLLVVHNNDLHSRFEETNAYGAPCKRNQCYGGFARMQTAIREATEEATKNGIPYVVMNAGDSFQGTPYFDSLKWHVVKPLLENLSIDVMTLGNHEFDHGVDSLSEYLRQVKIPVVCSNLISTSESRLDVLPNLTPSKILNVNGTKIGVIGFITSNTHQYNTSGTKNLRFVDELEAVKAEAKRLKESGVKIIIGLGHSGLDREVEIAREVPELSMVVGGHSHSLLYSPKDEPPSTDLPKESYPFMVTQKSGRKVPYVQAGAFTKYLGKLMLVFDDDGNVLSATGNTQLLNWTIPEDPEMKKLIDQLLAPLRDDLKVIKGYTRVPLLVVDRKTGQYESNLANFLTDVMFNYGVRRSHSESDENWTAVSISFINAFTIRAQIQDPGPITLEDVLMMVPFNDELFQVQYNGSIIRAALERSVESFISPSDDYLYFSGLKMTYDLSRNAYNRVVSVKVLCSNCSIPRYEALQNNKTYSVMIGAYYMSGAGGYSMLKEGIISAVGLGVTTKALVLEYIKRAQIIHPVLDGRIMVEGSHSTTN